MTCLPLLVLVWRRKTNVPLATLKPNERYAFVGKTGSGKTSLAIVLAGTFARTVPYPWEVWWIDTKNDKEDLATLRTWGFRNAASQKDRSPDTGGLPNALYFKIESKSDADIIDQAQAFIGMAYRRGNVVLVIDEYTQVVPSKASAGTDLLNVFQRGRSKNVGLIGLTQEPFYVPRQLISQATHICLLSLTYGRDIKYAKEICDIYTSPVRSGDKYGFFWSWVDGSGEWSYYKNQRQWYDDLMIALPK